MENFDLSDEDTPELFNSGANEELSTSSEETVLEQDEDVPFDLKNPLYDYGHGLSFWNFNHFIFIIFIYVNEIIKILKWND